MLLGTQCLVSICPPRRFDQVKITHLTLLKVGKFDYHDISCVQESREGRSRIKSWRRPLPTRSFIISSPLSGHTQDPAVHTLHKRKSLQNTNMLVVALCCMCWSTISLETTQRHTQNPAGLMNIGNILEDRNCTLYSDSAVKWFWCQLKSPLELGVLETCALLLQRHLVEWPCHWPTHFRCTKRPALNRTTLAKPFKINQIYCKLYMLLLSSKLRECKIYTWG